MTSIGCPLAATVAYLFDEAPIPHLLWGWLAIALTGENNASRRIEFVIPDEFIEIAGRTLQEAGFPLCSNRACPKLQHNRFNSPVPDVHFHLDEIDRYYNILALYSKSSTVWWLPYFSMRPPAEDDPHFILSTDKRLPPRLPGGASGPWTELYPIKTLKPNALTEAVILLLVRDLNQPNGLDKWWKQLLASLVEERELKEAIVHKTLRPELQPFWTNFHAQFPAVDQWVPLEELREKMMLRDELPSPPVLSADGLLDEWVVVSVSSSSSSV
ncbi:hypothetical protein MW887_010756 [Aspergillus wentii]|nr:hypothetical protein MW887_010756 [Aspergillus wentii]